jgi:hypothetical protein
MANGTLVVYSGTQPTNPDTALAGNTALATWTFSIPSFGAVTFAGGFCSMTASSVSASVTPSANGTGTFARLTESDGITVIGDLTVTATGGGGDITFGTTTFDTVILAGISSFTLSIPAD